MRRVFALIFLIGLVSCQEPEARRPVKVNSGSYFKASIERTRALLAKEEKLMQDIIKKDTVHSYVQSTTGSWYYFNVKNELAKESIRPGDLVTLTYSIMSFTNDTLYTMKDVGIRQYRADKLDLFPGLRNSVPLLKENEAATFLFPSSLAYGYHGDNNKIGPNVPLKSTLTILKVEKQHDSLP